MGLYKYQVVQSGSNKQDLKLHLFIKMNSMMMLLPILLLINVVKTETFAEKLQTFVNETPTGYTVSKTVRDGENCHCRVPASSSSSSSSSPLAIPDTSSSAGTTAVTEADTTTAPTTTAPTTTAPTTTDATTATTANTATFATGSSALTADYDTGAGSALTADYDTGAGSAGR